jgi:hypothetical protein
MDHTIANRNPNNGNPTATKPRRLIETCFMLKIFNGRVLDIYEYNGFISTSS